MLTVFQYFADYVLRPVNMMVEVAPLEHQVTI